MKVLFVINNMCIGGTRSSLLNFITYLSKTHKELEVNLFLLSKTGEYLPRIPDNIKVISGDSWTDCSFKSNDKLTATEKIKRGIICVAKRIFGEKKVLNRMFDICIQKTIKDRYDVVVGFQEGLCGDFAVKIPTSKCVLWVHNNYENLDPLSRGFYESYEKAKAIVFVAEASKKSFENRFPEFKGKMHLIRNIVLQEDVIKRSMCQISDGFNNVGNKTIKIVSVGRIAPQKAFDRVINAALKLRHLNFDFEWIIIGDGPDYKRLKEKTTEEQISDKLRFIGGKSNPYPYMKQADFLALSSIYEAQPMVIIEALTIGIPVLSTKFDSVNELLGNKKYGMVVENSTDGFIQGVCNLCENPDKIQQMKKETQNFVYDNEKIVQDFLKL